MAAVIQTVRYDWKVAPWLGPDFAGESNLHTRQQSGSRYQVGAGATGKNTVRSRSRRAWYLPPRLAIS